jgi:hypothetical protein
MSKCVIVKHKQDDSVWALCLFDENLFFMRECINDLCTEHDYLEVDFLYKVCEGNPIKYISCAKGDNLFNVDVILKIAETSWHSDFQQFDGLNEKEMADALEYSEMEAPF